MAWQSLQWKELGALTRSYTHARFVACILFKSCYHERHQLLQERIAKAHGSQCGFCTPGFVMSMYSLLRNNITPSDREIEDAFQGNLDKASFQDVKVALTIFFTTYGQFRI